MPTENETPISLELVYLNGQEHGAPPIFQDVRLNRDSQNRCEQIIALARASDKAIRSDSECDQCVEAIRATRDLSKELLDLGSEERAPWVRICTQITAAIKLIETQLEVLRVSLRKRLETWREMKLAGERTEHERLLLKAEEKRQEAKYQPDPRKRRQAQVAAKQIEAEAKATLPKPQKGADTVEYYEISLYDRVSAARNPDDIVEMRVNETAIEKRIKEAVRLGHRIPTFPGISITKKTRMRVH